MNTVTDVKMMPLKCANKSLIKRLTSNNLFAITFSMVGGFISYLLAVFYFNSTNHYILLGLVTASIYLFLQCWSLRGRDTRLNADHYLMLAKKYNEAEGVDKHRHAVVLVEEFHGQWHFYSFEPPIKNGQMAHLIEIALESHGVKFKKKFARLQISEAIYQNTQCNNYLVRFVICALITGVLYKSNNDQLEWILACSVLLSAVLMSYYLRAVVFIRNNLFHF